MAEASTSVLARLMLEADLDQVVAVEQAAYPIPWSRHIFEDCLASKNECWVIELERKVIGHAIISNVLDETHLLNLCVDPAFSGRGIGRWMLKELIHKAVIRNSNMFFLEVRESNRPAIELYLSEGFNETGMRKNYYPAENGREHAVLMSLDLSVDVYA